MKFLLRIPDEVHAYFSVKAKEKNLSMNEYFNLILENEMTSQTMYSNQLEIQRLLIELKNILKNQVKVVDENNKWNEIQTNMIYELLGVEENE